MSDFAIIKNRKNIKIKKYGIIKILYNVSFYMITAVLLISGIAKIIDPLPLLNTLKQITFLPTELQIIIAALLPVVEIGLALLLLMKIKLNITKKAVVFLFGIFLITSLYGTLAGFGTDCGCFGNTIKSGFGWGMVGRNTIFLILSLILTINAWPGKLKQ